MTCSKQLLAKVNNLIHLYNECLLKQCLKNNRMIDDHKLCVGHDVQHAHPACSASTTPPHEQKVGPREISWPKALPITSVNVDVQTCRNSLGVRVGGPDSALDMIFWQSDPTFRQSITPFPCLACSEQAQSTLPVHFPQCSGAVSPNLLDHQDQELQAARLLQEQSFHPPHVLSRPLLAPLLNIWPQLLGSGEYRVAAAKHFWETHTSSGNQNKAVHPGAAHRTVIEKLQLHLFSTLSAKDLRIAIRNKQKRAMELLTTNVRYQAEGSFALYYGSSIMQALQPTVNCNWAAAVTSK
ncbi:hypothetical protein Anapl_03514 [Anas platyrhynchos]|uniref:Uncharacterized protein n=1 Tax=Anas platyrhynchos TaxID=8839 RepID=R0LX75_ANAPL|nr:hypothetical protein Anapl_03514 [Anas platyrhynchos]